MLFLLLVAFPVPVIIFRNHRSACSPASLVVTKHHHVVFSINRYHFRLRRKQPLYYLSSGSASFTPPLALLLPTNNKHTDAIIMQPVVMLKTKCPRRLNYSLRRPVLLQPSFVAVALIINSSTPGLAIKLSAFRCNFSTTPFLPFLPALLLLLLLSLSSNSLTRFAFSFFSVMAAGTLLSFPPLRRSSLLTSSFPLSCPNNHGPDMAGTKNIIIPRLNGSRSQSVAVFNFKSENEESAEK